MKNFWDAHGAKVLALVLSLITLPVSFGYYIATALDGSWQRAINMAVKNNLKFGRDIVFTYGPLGYVVTRNTQYVHNIYILTADIFLCVGFFYLFYKVLTEFKGWFFALLVAMFFYRGTDFSASLFLVFLLFAIQNLKNNFTNHFELVYCSLAGVLAFFIKINYGIMAMAVLGSLALIMLFTNRKQLIVFSLVSFGVFALIYSRVNVDVLRYVRYALPAISAYDEAMFIEIDEKQFSFVSALYVFALYVLSCIIYVVRSKKEVRFKVTNLYPMALLALMFFLAYKNGFVRYDDGHVRTFFAVVPLLTIFSLYAFSLVNTAYAIGACLTALIITDINFDLNTGGKGFIATNTYKSVTNYFTSINYKQTDSAQKELKLSKKALDIIGNATIDIIPVDVSLLQLNHLNYKPRPVMQSYAAYTGKLDELNANYFAAMDRPEFVMMSAWSIDSRYSSWDEPLTKVMLRLNYVYADHISMNGDSLLTNAYDDYLLLRAKKGPGAYPKFDKLYDTTIRFGDTLRINFPSDQVIYMTAKTSYTMSGALKKILYQPSMVKFTQFFDDACKSGVTHTLIKPVVEHPVLINKYMARNSELINFITGALQYDRNIKGFTFKKKNKNEMKDKINISFMKLSNYR